MGIREDAVKAFARLMGAGNILKADQSTSLTPNMATGSSTQRSPELPIEWMTSTYAPGWPIEPVQRPEDRLVPREIDYPIAVNATIQPRTAYGLMPFAALKEAYETVAEIRLPVSTLLREMMIFRPHLVDEEGGEVQDHPFEWLVSSPDKVTSFPVWVSRFLKSTLVFDAGAFHYGLDSKGEIDSLRYVDGSTLLVLVDEHGNVPLPTDRSEDPEVLKKYGQKALAWMQKGKKLPRTTPAYAQIIKGTPFGWYDQNQIWYEPRSRRFDAPYGETAIEQAWAWVLICANVAGFELAHYREGNMPEGWVTSPGDWSLERIAAFEEAFNRRMSSGAAERMRARWLPAGSEWHQTKKMEFPQQLYDQAMSNISLFFGVPSSEYGKTPGSGLGGAGFEQAMQSTLFRMGLFPLKVYIENAFNTVLRKSGVDDVHFDLSFPKDEVDPEEFKKSVVEMFSNGLITFNSALSQLGQDSIGPEGDVHILIEYGSVTILEDVLKERNNPDAMRGPQGQIIIDPNKKKQMLDEQGLDANGNPLPDNQSSDGKVPESDAPERKEKLSEKDRKLAEKLLANRSPDLLNRFISLPGDGRELSRNLSKDQQVLPKHPKNPINGQFAPKGKVRLKDSDASRLQTEMGMEMAGIDSETIRRAFEGDDEDEVAMAAEELADERIINNFYGPVTLRKSKDGVMVCLDIPEAAGKKLQDACRKLLPDDAEPLDVEDMHITLFYPGDMETLQFTQAQLVEAVEEFSITHAPLKGVVTGLGMFNGGKGGSETAPLVAFFDSSDLPQFRQDLVETLHNTGVKEVIPTMERHGFIPHITIAYIPRGASLNDSDLSIEPVELAFKDLTVAWGETWKKVPLQARENVQKFIIPELAKHCGVCPEDDDYYGAPVTRKARFELPGFDYANKVEVVALTPEGLPPRPALWKPEGGEVDVLRAAMGGPQYVREEAAYLLDRSLNFYLVPVAYVAEVDDEFGAAVIYMFGASGPKAITEYRPDWIEKAAVLDYIMGQADRHDGNYFTHVDEADRPVLPDNGLSFPAGNKKLLFSPFFDAMRGAALSDDVKKCLELCVNDSATWDDIKRLVGEAACATALGRANDLLDAGSLPDYGDEPVSRAEDYHGFEKGGPGSGHFDHKGRRGDEPGDGQQGGSLPGARKLTREQRLRRHRQNEERDRRRNERRETQRRRRQEERRAANRRENQERRDRQTRQRPEREARDEQRERRERRQERRQEPRQEAPRPPAPAPSPEGDTPTTLQGYVDQFGQSWVDDAIGEITGEFNGNAEAYADNPALLSYVLSSLGYPDNLNNPLYQEVRDNTLDELEFDDNGMVTLYRYGSPSDTDVSSWGVSEEDADALRLVGEDQTPIDPDAELVSRTFTREELLAAMPDGDEVLVMPASR